MLNLKKYIISYIKILYHIHILYNLILQQGVFPNKLKIAIIGGNKVNMNNYMPISMIYKFLKKLLNRV